MGDVYEDADEECRAGVRNDRSGTGREERKRVGKMGALLAGMMGTERIEEKGSGSGKDGKRERGSEIEKLVV